MSSCSVNSNTMGKFEILRNEMGKIISIESHCFNFILFISLASRTSRTLKSARKGLNSSSICLIPRPPYCSLNPVECTEICSIRPFSDEPNAKRKEKNY